MKLSQLNSMLHFLRPGARVVDIGAFPGGWSQVAARAVRSDQAQAATLQQLVKAREDFLTGNPDVTPGPVASDQDALDEQQQEQQASSTHVSIDNQTYNNDNDNDNDDTDDHEGATSEMPTIRDWSTSSLLALRARELDAETLAKAGAIPPPELRAALKSSRAKRGMVVAVDPKPFETIQGVVQVTGGIEEPLTQDLILKALDGGAVDVVLCDAAHNFTGLRSIDADRVMELAKDALDFAEVSLGAGGVFVTKLLSGGPPEDQKAFLRRLEQNFLSVSIKRPKATRKSSSELYVHAGGFVPPWLSKLRTDHAASVVDPSTGDALLVTDSQESTVLRGLSGHGLLVDGEDDDNDDADIYTRPAARKRPAKKTGAGGKSLPPWKRKGGRRS